MVTDVSCINTSVLFLIPRPIVLALHLPIICIIQETILLFLSFSPVQNPEDTSLTNSTLSNNSSSNTLNQTIVIDSSTDNVSPGLKDFQLPKPKSVLSVSTAQNVVAKKEDASLTKPSFTNLTNQGIVKRKRKLLSTSRASFFKPLN